jgi:hypothetical protein
MATLSPNGPLGHPSRRPDLGALVSRSKAIRLDSCARYLPSLDSTKDARVSVCVTAPTHFVVLMGFQVFPAFPAVKGKTAPPWLATLKLCYLVRHWGKDVGRPLASPCLASPGPG